MSSWDQLSQHLEEQQTITQLLELISWDQETYMPSKSIEQRSKQSGLLSGLLHQKKTHPDFAQLIHSLAPITPDERPNS